jgi:hypothetical protein
MVDVQSFLGINAGTNVTQTVPPMDAAGKAGKGTFTWYAGDLMFDSTSRNTVTLTPTPIEFGGVGLSPADRVKQGQKSLVGGLSVARNGVANTPDANSRTQGTIGGNIRDFMLVMTKDNNHRYASGAAVEHMNGEGAGLPEDSQENSAMAMNYGIEPLWFRFGIPPNAPFGHCGGGCYGDEPDSHLAYSNTLVTAGGPVTCDANGNCTGDPVTPVFKATKGQEVRIHSVVPHSTSRGTTLAIHGHVWQRDPYVCPGEARNGLTGACLMSSIGSREIGTNPQGFAQGAQESLTSMSHFTYRLPSAGGAAAVTGDYLFRDQAGFGNASGLWGILRVQ